MQRIKSFEVFESMQDEIARDHNIKKQLEMFLDFFQPLTDEKIAEYLESSRMSESDFIQYLQSIKKHLSTNADNRIYGYLVDEYCNTIDEIISRMNY